MVAGPLTARSQPGAGNSWCPHCSLCPPPCPLWGWQDQQHHWPGAEDVKQTVVVPTHRLALLSDPHVPSIPPPQPELKLACILWGLRFRGDTKRGGVWGQETRGLKGQRDGYEAVGGDTGPLCATPPILLAPLSLAPSAFFLPPHS